MAVGIMIAGLLAAVLGSVLAIAFGLNLGSALILYGIFGLFGGLFACLASFPAVRSFRQQRSHKNSSAH